MDNIWGNIAETVTALATLAAVVVAVRTINAKRVDDRRTDRLNRINQQLSQLYGKLSILYETGVRDWCSFIEQNGNDSKKHPREFVNFFPSEENEDELPPPNTEQLKAYRKWLKTLFSKTNEQMLAVIYTNADLVIGKKMPQVLILFAQHVSSMRLLQVTLDEEERKAELVGNSAMLDDWREYVKLMAPYPGNTGFYILACFEVLKEEQERLLSTHETPFSEMEIAEKIEELQQEKSQFWNGRGVMIKAERAASSAASPNATFEPSS